MRYKIFFCVIFLVPLATSACQPKFRLYTINSFEPLEKSIEKLRPESLVVFDVDETLFALTPEISGEVSPLAALWGKEIAEADRAATDKMLHKIVPIVIEPRIVSIIKRLQNRKIKVIALTAVPHGSCSQIQNLLQYRVHLLNAIGIHLENSFPNLPALQFPDLGQNDYMPLFYFGILFSQPSKKGIVLEAFLKAIKLLPTLYYFDNEPGYVEEIAQTARAMNLAGIGFHYIGFRNVKPDTIREYNRKLKYLIAYGTWLSDEDAKRLLSNIDA